MSCTWITRPLNCVFTCMTEPGCLFITTAALPILILRLCTCACKLCYFPHIRGPATTYFHTGWKRCSRSPVDWSAVCSYYTPSQGVPSISPGNCCGLAVDPVPSFQSHPYYPKELVLPGYTPSQLPFELILTAFFGAAAAITCVTWVLSGRMRKASMAERLAITWWALTGAIHTIVEGAFVVSPEFYKDKSGNIMLEIWKEYAKADSRYATRDSCVVGIEALAMLMGPLSFLCMYGVSTRQPWRHTLQMLVSMGQLYGDVLYFMSAQFDGLKHSRPELLYFWFYFVFMNAIWIVLPGFIIFASAGCANKAVASQDRAADAQAKLKEA